MSTVSVRVDEQTKALMDLHEEINWSAVLRQAIQKKSTEIEEKKIDAAMARNAIKTMDLLRQRHKSKHEETIGLIRQWRQKRK